ncbi:MAG: nucleoside triphosphate pyrophosphohydrolase [Bernardetiaceae bacterium]
MNIPPPPPNAQNPLQRLMRVMDAIRQHCPWDQKQNMESIRYLTLEETYELSEAILNQKPEAIQEELGDVLFHIVYYSRLAREKAWFDIEAVINGAAEKIIRRHPHVFGGEDLQDERAVKQSWEAIKAKERGPDARLLDGVPQSLPAMIKALRMQEKARGVGFDWDDIAPVREKVSEEWEELHQAQSPEEREEEFGDLLFALINYARFLDINPENALEKTNQKFKRRLGYIETHARNNGRTLSQMTLEEMEALWQAAKGDDQRDQKTFTTR